MFSIIIIIMMVIILKITCHSRNWSVKKCRITWIIKTNRERTWLSEVRKGK